MRAGAQRFRDAIQLLVAMGGGWWGAGSPSAQRSQHRSGAAAMIGSQVYDFSRLMMD
jgi:hypothetical protein